MELDIISYHHLVDLTNMKAAQDLEAALLGKGIVGIQDVPHYESKTRAYINAARTFSAFKDDIKQQYAPDRDANDTEGYELGAEWFKNQDDVWQIDDKKASYYAFVPDHSRNKWPRELDLKTPYLELGELIFKTGKLLLNVMGLNDDIGLKHEEVLGYGRMLHYQKENDATHANPDWCGAHVDHGLFTGLVPAYYFRDGKEVDEPEEAGLYVVAHDGSDFEKMDASDKSILLFQVGEFGQLISHDRIRATKHKVRKANGGIERFTFALFYSPDDDVVIKSRSKLIEDARYVQNQFEDGKMSYGKWNQASLDRYRAK
jgi:isopenicillin N synthase-like dioxygenase